MSSSIYLAIPLMAFVVVLQATVMPHFPILSIVPQPMLLLTVAWGLLHGLREGLLWAFVAGLFADLLSASPLGATSLALMAAVTVAVFVQKSLPESKIVMPMVISGIATVVFWFAYLFLLRITLPFLINNLQFLGIADLAAGSRFPGLLDDIARNYGLTGARLRLILSMALLNALLILPVYWAFHKLEQLLTPRRVEV